MAYISKINQEKNEWSKIDSDLIAVGIFEEKTLTDLANQIDMENDKILTNAIKTGDLKGKVGEQNLIYVNQTGENVSLGTDLYDENLELKHTVPFWHNYGYIFHGPNKWHGMEEGKEIQVERRGIQLNYVTFQTDWPVHED